MGEYQIKLSDNLFIAYRDLQSNDIDKGNHFYTTYNVDKTVEDMFNFHIKKQFGNIIMLTNNENIDTTLTHINVFDTFCYTLIPQNINKQIYEKIYNYFFHSPMSVSYITWIGSLMFKPIVKSSIVYINGKQIDMGKCDRNCFLKKRNCSKIIPFLNVYHPEKQTDIISDVNQMCEILREFSVKLYQDFQNVVENEQFLNSFKETRLSVGIKQHYLLDPWGIY